MSDVVERFERWLRAAGAEPKRYETDDGGTLLEVEDPSGREVMLVLHPSREHAFVVCDEGEDRDLSEAWSREDVERLVTWLRGGS